MKHLLATFLFLTTSLSLWSQTDSKPGIIEGQIKDSITKKGMEYVSIRLFKAQDSSLVGGIYTDSDGLFFLDQISFGKYYLKITFTGYQTVIKSNVLVTPAKSAINLGVVLMNADKLLDLNEVTITARQELLTNSLDKKVYNVGEDVSTKGGTANDVLNNIPSIEVDQEGKISLRGDANVTILIDGRPSTLSGGNGKSLLDAFPANSIERIEVVTNPSAKYDPDGTTGIINIVLKKNKMRGINGNVSFTAGTGNVYNGSASLSVRNAKMNVYGTYAYRYYEGFRNYESYIARKFSDSMFYLDQFRDGTDLMENHTAKVGADFYMKNNQTIGFGVTGSTGRRERTGDLYNTQFGDNPLFETKWNRLSSDPTDNQNMDLNAYYKKDFKESKGSISVDFNQSFGKENIFGYYEEDYNLNYGLPDLSSNLYQQLNNQEQNRVTTAQVDYVRLSKKNIRFEAGTKAIIRKLSVDAFSETRNNATNQLEEDTLSNFLYEYDEQIYSVYGNIAHQYKKFKFQGGLRLEQAMQAPNLISDTLSFRNDYFSAFPSAYVRYELSKESELSLGYSRRINRPSAETLNPFTSYADPFNLRKGNPSVRPEYINSVEFGYAVNKKKMNVTATVFYRQTNNVIQRVREFYDNGAAAVTFANINQSQSYGAEFVLIYRPVTWFRNILSANGNQIVYQDDNTQYDFNNTGFNWSVKYAGTIDFWKKTATFQMNARYFSPIITAQGKVQPRAALDLSAEKTIKKNWTVGLRISDVFDTQEFRLEIDQPNVYQKTRFKQETRRVYVTLSYKFGRYEISKKERVAPDGGGGGMDF